MSIDISKIQPGDTVTIEGLVEAVQAPHYMYVRFRNGGGGSIQPGAVTAHTPKPKPSLVERMLAALHGSHGSSADGMAAALAVVREEIAGLPLHGGTYQARILAALTPAAAPEPKPLPTTPGSVVDARVGIVAGRFLRYSDGFWYRAGADTAYEEEDLRDWALVLDAADHPVGGAR